MLRCSYAQRMTIDQIAAAFGIHRATAARRVNSARDNLLRETRRRLSEQLALSSRDLDSVFRLIESRLDISVGRLLATRGAVRGAGAVGGGMPRPARRAAARRGRGAGRRSGMAGAGGNAGTGGGAGAAGTTGTAGAAERPPAAADWPVLSAAPLGAGRPAAGAAVAPADAVAAGGAAGGAGASCAPQFAAPVEFHTSQSGPYQSQTTATRYYWVEEAAQVRLHWSDGSTRTDHAYSFLASPAPTDPYQLRVSENVLLRVNSINSAAMIAYAPSDGAELGRITNSINIGPIALGADSTAYHIYAPSASVPDHAIRRWAPPASPTAALAFQNLQVSATELGLLAVTGDGRFVMASTTKVWLADPAMPTRAADLLFTLAGPIEDLQLFGATGFVHMTDAAAGRDFAFAYAVATPLDLTQAVGGLAPLSGCNKTVAGGGTLFGNRYIYEGGDGLYAVIVSGTTVGSLTRLTGTRMSVARDRRRQPVRGHAAGQHLALPLGRSAVRRRPAELAAGRAAMV